MKATRNFSTKALKHIRWWAWSAAVLPITSLAAIFFIWFFGTKDLFDIALTVGATIMFAAAAIWWWWTIWIVSKILQKERRVAGELRKASKEIVELKGVVKETFTKTDK